MISLVLALLSPRDDVPPTSDNAQLCQASNAFDKGKTICVAEANGRILVDLIEFPYLEDLRDEPLQHTCLMVAIGLTITDPRHRQPGTVHFVLTVRDPAGNEATCNW
jgi:hypothetical protein